MKHKTEYEICQQACKEAKCYCPEDNIFYSTVANTPMFIRVYFEKKGRLWKKEKGK